MEITATTSLIALIGDPVTHSLSPAMHNLAFTLQSIDCCYLALSVAPVDLEKALEGLKALHFKGANVTVPHKEKIIPFLDEIDDWGKKIGAINTLVYTHDRLCGFNTDAKGFVRAWKEEAQVPLEGGDYLLIGSGGSARAVYAALAEEKARQIIICARTMAKAEKIHHHFLPYYPDLQQRTISLEDTESLRNCLARCEAVINCTPAGMRGKAESPPLPCLEALKKNAIVYDLVYSPLFTTLLLEASRRGHPAINGLGMLLHQGALAFELWTGIPFPMEAVKKHIQEKTLQQRINN
jgi:shikimate dehydrogenase